MKIAIISKRPDIREAYRHTPEELFDLVGSNTGNLALYSAADSHVAGEKGWFDWDFDPELVNASYDVALIVCANLINPDVDLETLSDGVGRLRIPVTAASIGVQGAINQADFNLLPGTKRFLDLLSAMSVSFGVRGETAGRFLERNGIRNFRLIGCPSNFLNLDPLLPGRFLAASAPVTDVAMHWEKFPDEERSRLFRVKLSSLEIGARVCYHVQSPFSAFHAALSTRPGSITDDDRAIITDEFGYDGMAPHEFVRQRLRTYLSVEHWLADMSRYDLSAGPRLHGNIIALQAGIPAIVVIHDERTRELAQAMEIPSLTVDEFLKASSYHSMAEMARTALPRYLEARTRLAQEYVLLMDENRIPITPELRAFAGLLVNAREP